MKMTIKKVLILVAATSCFSIANAQKIAHLSFDSLISMMPETKTATEEAQKFYKGLEEEMIAMQNELENKYKDYVEKEPSMSELSKRTKQEDLQQLQNRIGEFQKQAEREVQIKQAQLTAPIFDKAKKAVEAVAKEGSYKYVLDTSTNNTSVLYSEASDDILMLVKKKLDGMPLATIPGVKAPGTGGVKPPPSPAGGAKPTGK